MKNFLKIIFCLQTFSSLFAQEESWFIGPLQTPTGKVIHGGHVNFEPYVYATYSKSFYDLHGHKKKLPLNLWSISTQLVLQIGLTQKIDIMLTPTWFYNVTKIANTFSLGDLPIQLDFQVREETSSCPSIKFFLAESFPLGRFDRLDPNQFGLDSSGSGSYITQIGVTLSKLISFSKNCFLELRWNGEIGIPTKVHVRGVNTYGGVRDSNGMIDPPKTINLSFGCEYSLTRHVVFACDWVANYAFAAKFRGQRGTRRIPNQEILFQEFSKYQYSIAPALEYDWNDQLGAIAGVWFTVAGCRSSAFTSYATAINYYY